MIFYKAVAYSAIRFGALVPGTVTNSYDEAYMWWERYNSRKKNIRGAARHIDRQPSVIIAFEYNELSLLSAQEFQRAGVSEHDRASCWTSQDKTKAQVNDFIENFAIILDAPKS